MKNLISNFTVAVFIIFGLTQCDKEEIPYPGVIMDLTPPTAEVIIEQHTDAEKTFLTFNYKENNEIVRNPEIIQGVKAEVESVFEEISPMLGIANTDIAKHKIDIVSSYAPNETCSVVTSCSNIPFDKLTISLQSLADRSCKTISLRYLCCDEGKMIKDILTFSPSGTCDSKKVPIEVTSMN